MQIRPGRTLVLLAGLAVALAGLPAPAGAEPPRIDRIHWPGIDSYCTFRAADHRFVFADPATWVFVLFSGLPRAPDQDVMQPAYMRIDGVLRELELRTVSEDADGSVRRFTTYEAVPATVTLSLTPTGGGPEHTAYQGSVTVTRGGETASLAVIGDCGV
jgi:hypothetical protein